VSDSTEPSAIVISGSAKVELSLEPCASGHVLRIRDLNRGGSTTLDPMELEGLCWLTAAERQRLLAPRSEESAT
jgi:hypothetical protein